MPLIWIVGIIFVVLKLAGVIAWSWWLVTLPFWIGIVFVLAMFLFFGIGFFTLAGLISIFENRK